MPLESQIFYALRSTVAVGLVIACISFGWYVAVKLVLVHIPLVQEICGLRKKPPRVRPTPRFTHVHSNTTQSIPASDEASTTNDLQGDPHES